MVKLTFDADACKGCGLCIKFCPKGLLAVSKDRVNSKGHHPAVITDPASCTGCASCATMCPECIITVERE